MDDCICSTLDPGFSALKKGESEYGAIGNAAKSQRLRIIGASKYVLPK
ncbi:hypothetical protein PI125_g7516 [Phytophthora idaei]|nr:hypothetical protein PI125_g7516 [Phytophthora idaei]